MELLDLEEIVTGFAQSFIDSDQKKTADVKNPIINWDFMYVKYGETVYVENTCEKAAKEQSHVLFSATFTNNTPREQTFALKAVRRTKSECRVGVKKSFTFGANVHMRLHPPNPVIGANCGFKTEKSVTQSTEQIFINEMEWSVDNSVTVPPGFETKAELVIKENKYDGDFEQIVTFEGRILVAYEHKKTKENLQTVTIQVKNLFDTKNGFKKDSKGNPTYKIKGNCSCHFGVQQDVKLTETEISGNGGDQPKTEPATQNESLVTRL